MTRYIGLDTHATTCTFSVVGPNGKRLRTDVVETNGQALVEYVKLIPKPRQLCMEEGTQSAWLYELLSPHVDELVVTGVEQSRGQKSDARDAYGLAEALRLGAIKARVYKAVGPYGKLRELGHMHGKVVGDHVRSINRLRCLYRSRGLSVPKAELMDGDKREELLKALPEKMRESADILFAESSGIGEQRERLEKALLSEAKKHTLYPVLRTCPGIGPIRAALLMGIVVSPHRFRSKKQFWAYCGLGIVMRSSSDWAKGKDGSWIRAKMATTRGLNRNHNRTLKWIFKGAATTVITSMSKER